MSTDDFIIVAENDSIINTFVKLLQKEVDVREVNGNKFLGVQFSDERSSAYLSQSRYVEEVLERFGMSDCHAVKTPGVKGTVYNSEGSPEVSQDKYREAIRSLLYLARCTRPDIAFTVSKLSQYCSDPRDIHWQGVKRLLKYLQGRKGMRLEIGEGGGTC